MDDLPVLVKPVLEILDPVVDHCSLQRRDLDMAKLLVGNNAGINYTGYDTDEQSDAPLFTTLYHDSFKVAEYILQQEG